MRCFSERKDYRISGQREKVEETQLLLKTVNHFSLNRGMLGNISMPF